MSDTNDSNEPTKATKRPAGAARQWGSVRRRGGGFHVRFTVGGQEYQRGPFSTWHAADKLRRAARSMLDAKTPIAEVLASVFGDFHGARLTFKDAAAHYLAFAAQRKRPSSLADDEYRLGALERAPWAGKVLGLLKASDFLPWVTDRLTARKVKRLRARRDDETRAEFNALDDSERFVDKVMPGASTTTVIKDLNLVSAVFGWAMGAGYVESNPIPRVRKASKLSEKGRPERVYLTATEALALIDSCSPTLRPFVLAAVHTGARRSELLELRWRAVDSVRREITIEAKSEKSGRGRTVPLTPALFDTLATLLDARGIPSLDGSDHVFVLAEGEPLTKPVLRQMFEATVARCSAIPKVKRDALTLHGLRHSAASIMVAAGVPILDVARILGHSTLAVTMRYARFAPESGRSAVDALSAALTPAASPAAPAEEPSAIAK